MPLQMNSQEVSPPPFPRRFSDFDHDLVEDLVAPAFAHGSPESLFLNDAGDSLRSGKAPLASALFRDNSPALPPALALAQPLAPHIRVEEHIPPRLPGVRGRTAFTKGEVVFREKAYLVISSDMDSDAIMGMLSRSSFQDEAKFWEAKQTRLIEDDVMCIVESNAIVISLNDDEGEDKDDKSVTSGDSEDEEEPVRTLGMFEYIAKLNHSCVPNCIWHWDRDLEEMVLTAWRDIAQGEELTVCVYDEPAFLTWSHIRRNRSLDRWYHFPLLPALPGASEVRHCRCNACAYDLDRLKISDDRLAKYRGQLAFHWTRQEFEAAYVQEARTRKWWRKAPQAVNDLKEASRLMELEEKWAEIGEIWLQELMLWIQWGRVEEALHAAEQGRGWYRISAGDRAADEYFNPIANLLRDKPEDLEGWGETAEAMRVQVERSETLSKERRKKRREESHARWRATLAAEIPFPDRWRAEDRAERKRKWAEHRMNEESD